MPPRKDAIHHRRRQERARLVRSREARVAPRFHVVSTAFRCWICCGRGGGAMPAVRPQIPLDSLQRWQSVATHGVALLAKAVPAPVALHRGVPQHMTPGECTHPTGYLLKVSSRGDLGGHSAAAGRTSETSPTPTSSPRPRSRQASPASPASRTSSPTTTRAPSGASSTRFSRDSATRRR